MKRFLALLLMTVPVAAQAQSDRGAQAAVETAEAAMQRGYGARCSLEAVPVAAGGYWPCLDIGPYRFVKEYGRTRGFVILKDAAPFQILESTNGSSEFTVSGEWMRDLPGRVSEWWEDEVQGGKTRRAAAETDTGRRNAADVAVQKYLAPAETSPAPQAAAPPQAAMQPPPPQPFALQYYAPQPAYAPQAVQMPPSQMQPPQAQAQSPVGSEDLRSRPIPAGGVVLAPGVIGYPNGVPTQRTR